MSDEFPAALDDHSCPPCKDGNHERCKRTMIYVGWDHTCTCYTTSVMRHAALFHREALKKMEQSLSNAGYVVTPPGESLVIYRLEIVSTWYGGNSYNSHLTMDGAKADAQSRLNEFAKLIDEDPETRDSTEELTTRTLEWHDEDDWFMMGREKFMTGRLAPHAWFAEGSAFKIVKVKIQP